MINQVNQPPRNSLQEVLCKKVFLKSLQNSQEKTSARFFNKVACLQLHSKRDPGTGVFVWILRNFQERFYYRIPPDDCFYHSCLNIEANLGNSNTLYLLLIMPQSFPVFFVLSNNLNSIYLKFLTIQIDFCFQKFYISPLVRTYIDSAKKQLLIGSIKLLGSQR